MPNERNDPKKWFMKGQTAIKHQILEYYLPAFSMILSRGNRMGSKTLLHYIDGFAGRGVYQGGERGSPIIAMEAADRVLNDTSNAAVLKIHAIEIDAENFESLKAETSLAADAHPGAQYELHHGSFLSHIGPVMASLGTYEYAFIFIDPFGYKDAIELDVIVGLIARPRTEVFITFMSHNINRYVGDTTKTKNARMAAIFGHENLKTLQSKKDRQEMLAKLYGLELQRLASLQGINDVLIYSTGIQYEDKEQNIYHLIHVSRDPKARLVMEKAVKKANLLVGTPPMMLGWEQGKIEQRAIDYLQGQSAHRAIAREVAGAMWRQYWDLTWLGDVRQVLLAMEVNGKVMITRPGAKPRKVGAAIDETDMVQLSR